MAQGGIVTLPASITLHRRNLVRYVHEDVVSHGLLIADGDHVLNPMCKLEVFPARSGNGRVHIRCSYNNKFLAVRREGDSVVAPVAEAPEEDESAWGCTMFVPSYPYATTTFIRLLHVQRGRDLFIDAQSLVLGVSEQAATPVTAPHMDFMFIDLAPLFPIPRYVAFKGDNGHYLRFTTINNQPFLQFSSAVDKWHASALHEIDIQGNLDVNRVRIRCHVSNARDGFWRRNRDLFPQWIHADSVSLHQNLPVGHIWSDSIFTAVKVGENSEGIVVALDTVNNQYLRRESVTNVQDGLSPRASTIIPEARLVLEELVRSRLIFNVNFNRLDTRIYSNEPETMTNQNFNNVTSLPQTMELTFTYTQSQTSTWNATASITVGVSTSFRTGVPFIADGEISTSVETTASYEWGNSYTQEETREDKISITVPSMTRVRVSRVETKGTCDVPFSYSQEDTLYNWEKRVTQKHDGLYQGVNSFNINYLAVEEPLQSDPDRESKTYPVFPHTSRMVSSLPAA